VRRPRKSTASGMLMLVGLFNLPAIVGIAIFALPA
jgi:hypothetical protein